MKRILFTVAAAMFMMAACNDKDAGNSGGDSQAQKNKENNRKVYKAIETGDATEMKQWIDKDFVDHHGKPNGDDVVGVDSVLAMLQTIKSAFTDLKMELIADAADGDYVFSLVRMTGTTTANPGMGMPPNQKIDMTGVDVVKFKGDKATDHWSFNKMPDIIKMMGGMPAPDQSGPINVPAAKDTIKN